MKFKFKKLLGLVVTIILSTACSSIEIFKEKTEFRPYKAYQSFAVLNREVGLRGFNDEFLDAMVSDGLITLFEAQGMVYERQNPELVIRYSSNEDLRQREIINNMLPMWGWRVWDPFLFDPMFNSPNMFSTKNYELLQLIVEFIDTSNNQMLMQLTAVSEVQGEREKRKRIRKSVEKIAETYFNHIKNYKN